MFEAGSDERIIAPTPRRVADARRAGLAPRSRELTSAVAACAGVAALGILGSELWQAISAFLQTTWSDPVIRYTGSETDAGLASAITRIALLLATLLSVPAIAAVTAAMFPLGFRLTVRFPAPRWSHVSPPAGMRRMLDGVGFGPLAGLVLKVSAACLITVWMLNRSLPALAAENADRMAAAFSRMLIEFSLTLTALLLLLAVGDWIMRRRRFLRSLRMTVAEAREESQTSKSPRRQRTGRRRRVSVRFDAANVEPSAPLAAPGDGPGHHLPSDPLIS